jgi:hypothetical protein
VRSNTTYRIQAKKDARKAQHIKDMVLVRPVTTDTDSQSYGDVTIDPRRENNILTTTDASNAAFGACDRTFFASSTSTTRHAKDEQEKGNGRKHTTRWTGAAIAYRPSTAEDNGNDINMTLSAPRGILRHIKANKQRGQKASNCKDPFTISSKTRLFSFGFSIRTRHHRSE